MEKLNTQLATIQLYDLPLDSFKFYKKKRTHGTLPNHVLFKPIVIRHKTMTCPHINLFQSNLSQVAIITTYQDYRILLTNPSTQDIFSTCLGKSIFDYIDPSFRSNLKSMIDQNSNTHQDQILICGHVIPILTLKGTCDTYLWLKQKTDSSGTLVYIWIFKKIIEDLILPFHVIEKPIKKTLPTSIQDYEILDTLGEGAYGIVKSAIKKTDPTKKKVVIKYVYKSRILVDCWIRDRKLGTLPVEIHVLNTLRKHNQPNLCQMLEYFEDVDFYYIVMELYGDSMDLFDYIELNDNPPQSELQHIFRQIALGVCHLHDLKIIHRDIKDENVIIDRSGGVRLIDFGSAAYLKPNRQYDTFVGTLDYAAPEVLKGQAYSGKPQDIWALGILLFTLIYRENPFYNMEEIMDSELRIPFVLSEDSVDLIKKMLDRNVDKRIDIHGVLAHPWLN